MIAAARGYRCVLTMPDSMSVERRKILQAYGVELILTPAAEGMRGAIAKADEIQKERGGFKPLQFDNPANPEMHYRTTGPEIWEDTEGQLDAFVAGIGTGGTFMGVTRFLKERRKVHCVVVEPEASAIFSGGQSGPHKIQGIGPGFVPKVVHPEVFDEVIAVALEDALGTSRELARGHGMLSGISAGANVFAARQVASALAASNGTGEGLRVVTVIPSNGERYLSTVLFNDPE
jgi:cysteine synthase A